MPGPVRIACFGDSLTEGYGLSFDEALPAALERRLRDEGFDVVCLNHGVSGDTAGDGVQRLGSVLAEEPQAVVLEFGANDSFLDEAVEVVEAHLRILIERFRDDGVPVLLVGVNAGLNPDSVYRKRFEAIFPALAERYRLPLFPDILATYQDDPALTLMDGLHPNAAGVETMARALLPQVAELARSVSA